MTATPSDTHEWLSFEDDKEDRTWLIDVTFLESNWQCIYGAGCQGVYTEPAPELVQGCCSYGAHFVDEKDVKRIEKIAAKLTDDQWQLRKVGLKRGITQKQGKDTTTRVVKGACVFLNRPDFAAGPGCALHAAAVANGVAPMKWKPDVCWQLPLQHEDSVDEQGHVTSKITEWQRRNWGPAGQDFHWWCTEAPEAFTGAVAVYVSLADELNELLGKAVFRRVQALLDERAEFRKSGATALPHPAVRKHA